MGLADTIQEFGVKISLNFDEKAAKNAQTKIKKLGDDVKSLAVEMAALGAGVFGMANMFTSNARSLEDQSAQLGISTKQLQEWEYAAKVAANVGREDLVDSMKTLGKFLDEARAGVPEATQALYDIAKAGGQDPTAFLAKLQDKTYGVTDAMKDLGAGLGQLSEKSPMAASRIAELAFGSSKLMPMFKLGAKGMGDLTKEADKNWVINDKMLQQGKQMDQQFTKIWMVFKKMGYEIGFNVMKHIKPLVDQFAKWFSANKQLIASGINEFLDQSVELIKNLVPIVAEIVKGIGWMVEKVGGASSAIKLLFEAFLLFKGITFAADLVTAFTVLLPLIGGVVSMIGALSGLKEAFAAMKLISGIADIIPALQLAGGALVGSLAPIIGIAAAIAAIVVGIHDVYEIYQAMKGGASFGDAFKNNTWTGAGVQKIKGMFTGDKAQEAVSAPEASQAGAAANVNAQNTFNTTNNIAIPPGTTPNTAANMISNATVMSNEKQLIKAKQDAGTKRVR